MLHHNYHWLQRRCRYAPGDPACDDAYVVAWFVTMARSAETILLAEAECLRSAGVQSALRAVGDSLGGAVPEPLVVALLEAVYAAYGMPLKLWSEDCPQTGGPAIAIAPRQQTSGPFTLWELTAARTGQGKGPDADSHAAIYTATGSKHTMITFPRHRHAYGAHDPRKSDKLCRFTAEQLTRANVLRIESPNGRRVPRHLESRLANAHRVATTRPALEATEEVRRLLGAVSDWLRGAPVEVTVTVGTCSDDPGAPLISELVISKGVDKQP